MRNDAKLVVRTLHPDPATKVPASKNWLHEIKHDGYRLIVHREGKRVRLFTRNGFDWSDRYPLITEPRCASGQRPLCWTARPCCWVLTESPTSTTWKAASTMTRCSSMPSICW
ncbi:hypothetical protein [Bradyrhizobium sp. AUGA SZCCT0182]|uniref:ATP-dependent DNA ligase n=1 Tax=Bradyrhizobium sp. AUGA SZCCT0182 TaxID=2807667 RepID=UPI00289B611C|nr:hypothetical protein [Bradyrhizobium sp. AUGA SZCCT0182]